MMRTELRRLLVMLLLLLLLHVLMRRAFRLEREVHEKRIMTIFGVYTIL